MMKRLYHFIKRIFHKEITSPFFTKEYFKDKPYQIGDYTYGKPKVLFENNESNLFIGKYCSIAENVTILLGGNHKSEWVTTYPFTDLPEFFGDFKHILGHPSTNGDVIIGNDVWIGLNSVILSGVKISDGAIIGTNSLVTKNVGPYEIWGGNPAKLIRKRFDDKTIEQLNQIAWWNWSDKKVKEHINELCSGNISIFLKNE